MAQHRRHLGVPQGEPIKVFPTGQASPIAMAADGRFAIAWRGPDGNGDGIFVQRFAADGSFVGSRLLVNDTIAGMIFRLKVPGAFVDSGLHALRSISIF